MAPPRFTKKISQKLPPGRPGGIFLPVLFLKVAKVNFRKSQAEPARNIYIFILMPAISNQGGIMPPPLTSGRVKYFYRGRIYGLKNTLFISKFKCYVEFHLYVNAQKHNKTFSY